MLNISFRVSHENTYFERSVYDFLTFLSDVGGLFGTVFVVGKFIVGFFLEDLYC